MTTPATNIFLRGDCFLVQKENVDQFLPMIGFLYHDFAVVLFCQR
jgi:hypothetical protein